jgi:hypothetical protein
MKQKLQIGDKIKWNVPIGGGEVYTILDIDTSRPTVRVGNHTLKKEILFQWDQDGRTVQRWGHDYHGLNQNLNKGGIIILNPRVEPVKWIKKFTL